MINLDFDEYMEKIKPDQKDLFFEAVIGELFKVLEPKKRCPICGEMFPLFLPFNNRKDALCPSCGSLERHRFVYYYLINNTDLFIKPVKLLHFAPEGCLYDKFNNGSIDYLPVDSELRHNVKEAVDISSIPYEDNSFDIIYASHVLEHVEDDIKAMSELHRCVKPSSDGGFVILMVPFSRNIEKTIENEEYDTPELRQKNFHQENRFRFYGHDVVQRLESVGFQVDEIVCEEVFNEFLIDNYGLSEKGTLFVCRK